MADQVKLAAENSVSIVGRLADVDVRTGVDKGNKEYVSIKASVVSSLQGKDNIFKIEAFTYRLTQENKESNLYKQYIELPNSKGKKVQVSGSLRENRIWSKNKEQMISFSAISGRFFSVVPETTLDTATFIMSGFVVKSIEEKKNKAGEIYRYDFSIGQQNYKGDNMSVFGFNVQPTNVELREGVSSWKVGDTVRIQGDLMSIEETTVVEDKKGGFGAPITKTYTNTISGFYITGGSNPFTIEEGAYPSEVITNLISAYKAKDAAIAAAAKSAAENTSSVAAVQGPTIPVTSRQTSLI